eukprot:1039036-Alexandrium_andersonii.AAC.1
MLVPPLPLPRISRRIRAPRSMMSVLATWSFLPSSLQLVMRRRAKRNASIMQATPSLRALPLTASKLLRSARRLRKLGRCTKGPPSLGSPFWSAWKRQA